MKDKQIAVSAQVLLNADEAAHRLGVNVRYVRRLVTERRIPYYKVGKFIRFSSIEIDQWLDDRRVPETAEQTAA